MDECIEDAREAPFTGMRDALCAALRGDKEFATLPQVAAVGSSDGWLPERDFSQNEMETLAGLKPTTHHARLAKNQQPLATVFVYTLIFLRHIRRARAINSSLARSPLAIFASAPIGSDLSRMNSQVAAAAAWGCA